MCERWIAALSAAGVKKITGSIVADADIFDDNPVAPGWQWADVGNYFGAQVCGLNVCDNYYRLNFKPGKAGEAAQIRNTEPDLPALSLFNYVNYGGPASGDNAYIFGAPFSYQHIITGTVPALPNGYTIKGAMPDPPLYCAQRLTERLNAGKIKVSGEPVTTRILRFGNKYSKAERKAIDTYLSPPLSDIVAKTNIFSLNMYAESLAKTLSRKKVDNPAIEAGVNVVMDFWNARGVDSDELIMIDGSGLSPTNLVTPRALSQIFYLISKDKIYNTFSNSLSVAGQSGTLREMCLGTPASGNLRGKSGTLTRVLCYTGYITDLKGTKLCFTLMVNRYGGSHTDMKAALERIMVSMGQLKV